MLSGLFFGVVPGFIAVAIFLLIGLPLLIVAATAAIHLRRWLRQKKKARAKAAKLAARNAAARRKAPSSRERQSPPQKPARAAPRRVRAVPSASPAAGANGEGP